jgi:hypothetical protein
MVTMLLLFFFKHVVISKYGLILILVQQFFILSLRKAISLQTLNIQRKIFDGYLIFVVSFQRVLV